MRVIPTDRYRFEKQETDIRAGDELCAKGEKIGEVVAIDIAARTIDVKKTRKSAEVHPAALYVKDVGPGIDVLAEALFRIGTWVAENGIDVPGPYRAARDLLLRRPPRLADTTAPLMFHDEATVNAAKTSCILFSPGAPARRR